MKTNSSSELKDTLAALLAAFMLMVHTYIHASNYFSKLILTISENPEMPFMHIIFRALGELIVITLGLYPLYSVGKKVYHQHKAQEEDGD